MLERITALVNTVLREEEEGAADLKPEDIVKLIGVRWKWAQRHGHQT